MKGEEKRDLNSMGWYYLDWIFFSAVIREGNVILG